MFCNIQVLTSNGPDAAPSFQDAAGGAWTLLSTQTASNDATIDFTSGIDTTYKNYVVIGSNIVPATNAQELRFRHSVSSTFQTTGYYYSLDDRAGGTNENLGTFIAITNQGIGDAEGVSFEMIAYDPAGSGYTMYNYRGSYHDNASIGGCRVFGGSGDTSARALDGFRFYFASGNISSGTFKFYGIS